MQDEIALGIGEGALTVRWASSVVFAVANTQRRSHARRAVAELMAWEQACELEEVSGDSESLQQTRARRDEDLLGWMSSFGGIGSVGVEGSGNYGAGLTRFLLAEGVGVVEVVVRPDRRARRFNGKSDTLDAENAARAVLAGERTTAPKHRDVIALCSEISHPTLWCAGAFSREPYEKIGYVANSPIPKRRPLSLTPHYNSL